MDNLLEGYENFEYKDNFWNMLNRDIKVNREYDILYNIIINKFTNLLKIMDQKENIPPNQMCMGELGEWGLCSKECGRGKKVRRFNELQKAGETGIQCIYENGQIESKECFNKLCSFSDKCEDNFDCISNYCDPKDKKCSYHNICSRAKLQNCNFDQCIELNRKFGEYTYDLNFQRCENIANITEINRIEIDETNPDPLGFLAINRGTEQININKLTESEQTVFCSKIKQDHPDVYEVKTNPGNVCVPIDGGEVKLSTYPDECHKYYYKQNSIIYPCIWKNVDKGICAYDLNKENNAFCEQTDSR